MTSWRTVVAIGLCLAAGAACASSDEPGSVAVVAPTTPPAATPVVSSAPPAVTTVDSPATVTTPADRVDEPLTVWWIGGSDVAWDDYSLPDELLVDMPSFGERPIVMRTRVVQAVMPEAMHGLLADALVDDADAVIMSVNPVWLHWDGSACLGSDLAPRAFYACVLSPVSAEVTARRGSELRDLFDLAASSGVPVYAYTQPHSTDVLADPTVAPAIEAAEAALATFDPGVPTVRFRSRIYTRDTEPVLEGDIFFDMVHPTPAGAAVLTDWLAADLADFWRATDRFGV